VDKYEGLFSWRWGVVYEALLTRSLINTGSDLPRHDDGKYGQGSYHYSIEVWNTL